MDNSEVKKLYDALINKGYTERDLGDAEVFARRISDEKSRKQLYDYVVKRGDFRIGDYDTYERRLTGGAKKTDNGGAAPTTTTTATTPTAPTATTTPTTTEPTLPEPKQPETPAPGVLDKPLTEQDKIRLSVGLNNLNKRHEATMGALKGNLDNMTEWAENVKVGTKVDVAEGKPMFNPETKSMDKTYLSPLARRYFDGMQAYMDASQFREAIDMTTAGRLRRAQRELRELQRKMVERRQQVYEDNKPDSNGGWSIFLERDPYSNEYTNDEQIRMLEVAINEKEKTIGELEDQVRRDRGDDPGLWHQAGRVASDPEVFTFGLAGMRKWSTIKNSKPDDESTPEEDSIYQDMLSAINENEQTAAEFAENWSNWERWGQIFGHVPFFGAELFLTGGGFKGIKLLTKMGTKLGAKAIGKEAAEEIAKQGVIKYIKSNGWKGVGNVALNGTIKSFGVAADELLFRAPLVVNTIHMPQTITDVYERKYGDIVENEEGKLEFANDKSWSTAIWESEADNTIEVYSEMFGEHLDGVMSIKGWQKASELFGLKRLSGVLAKAEAGELGTIINTTRKWLGKAGVNSYLGEVGEEYYGQLLRTGVNLDEAYKYNEDGTRTNLFFDDQWKSDIWGGMLITQGLLMLPGHAISAGRYTYMRHRVNRADATASELIGAETWGALRQIIDNTSNDAMGEMAVSIMNDASMTQEARDAAIGYIGESLRMRGFNLGTMAQGRNGTPDGDAQSLNESYIDGYNAVSQQERNDANNMYNRQRERVSEFLDEDALNSLDEDVANGLAMLRGSELTEEQRGAVLEYLNSKQVRDGMMQRVKDDINGRIDQSNAMINARTNRDTRMIHPATMKQGDRKVYVVSGNLVQYDDKSGIDNSASDESVIVRDAETGNLEQVSPDAILNIDEPIDPLQEKIAAAEQIRQQMAQQAANEIDGVITFNAGDTYEIPGAAQGQTISLSIVANEEGIVDNGDGTVNVSMGGRTFPMVKEALQAQVNAVKMQRIYEFERQRAESNLQQQQQSTSQPETPAPQEPIKFNRDDEVTLRDAEGNAVQGRIITDEEDGHYQVETDTPLNGRTISNLTADEISGMLIERNGEAVAQPEAAPETPQQVTPETPQPLRSTPQGETTAPQQQGQSAFERVPKDAEGNPIYEQTDSDTAWDAIVEQTEGDEQMAQTVAESMVADKEAELKKVQKAKPKAGTTIAEKIAAEKEHKVAVAAAQQAVDAWKKIAGTVSRRKSAAEAEKARAAAEAEKARRAEEERLRAEREEAARIEREKLNGVPDMTEDKPADARKRGYRRVNGHIVERQQPVGGLRGKEVEVKFSDKEMPKGRVAVIESEELQPSHLQGQRNPLHFIDEAQPKERKDAASIASSRKIAGNIRPEEITSSVTAYTGAPTVNARGEVIQGNNRSDALRLMWETQPEQAAKYKQYLIEHAEEFGLNPEEIAAMKHPVLVGMLDVKDEDAIRLGQYVAQDTESGGIERIKPKNAVQKMGNDMRTFANLLLKSADDDMSISALIDANGVDVLKWMNEKGYITPTQYSSAFDSRGNLTDEAKNDLRGIMYQSIFQGASTSLEEMFYKLPIKAQRAILATLYRDFDSPTSERMTKEVQSSVMAYYALQQYPDFIKAKTQEETMYAIESWKRQYQMDDATGESYVPAKKFSNFALHLAMMYKVCSQNTLQGTFNKMFDLIQGTQEATLFETPDNTPRTLAEAIKETLNIDYNGQNGSNLLAGDNTASQRGEQGSPRDTKSGESDKGGEQSTDNRGRADGTGEQVERDEKGRPFVLSPDGTTVFGEITDDTGLPPAPIKLSEGFQDSNGNGYGLLHIEANHGEQIRKAGFASVEEFVLFVSKHYDKESIKIGKQRKGTENSTYLIQVKDKHENTLFVELSRDGSYWNVNSGGIFREGYSKKKETVAKTEPQQPNNAVSTGSSLSAGDENGISRAEPNGKPTVSVDKGRKKSGTVQEPEGEKDMLRRKWETMKRKMPEGTVFIVEHNGRYYAFGDDATRVNAALTGKGDAARTDYISLDEKQYNDVIEVLDLKGFSIASYSAKDIKDEEQPAGGMPDKLQSIVRRLLGLKSEMDRYREIGNKAEGNEALEADEKYDELNNEASEFVKSLDTLSLEELNKVFDELGEKRYAFEWDFAKLFDKKKTEEAQMRNREKARAAVQAVMDADLPKVKVGNPKFNIHSYTDGTSKSTPAIGGIFHDNGYAVATDTHIVVASKEDYDAEHEGHLVTKDGDVLNYKFPKWRSVLNPDPKAMENPMPFDCDALLGFIASVEAKLKADKMGPKKIAGTMQLVRLPNGDVGAVDLSTLKKFAIAAKHFGAKEIAINGRRGVIYTSTEKGSVMIYFNLTAGQGHYDYEEAGKTTFGFDMSGKKQREQIEQEKAKEENGEDTNSVPKDSVEKPAPKNSQKIEDFGEKINGARKDLVNDIVKKLEQSNPESFAALQLTKAFSRPKIKELIDTGAITEKEAVYIEALSVLVLGRKKPVATKRYGRKEIEEWANEQAQVVEKIKSFIETDADTRAEIISSLKKEYEQCLSTGEAISPVAFAYAVIERAGLGDKSGYKPVDLHVKQQWGKQYTIRAGQGYVYVVGKNLEEAVSTQVAALQIKNGVSDVEFPMHLFKVGGTGRMYVGVGTYEVIYNSKSRTGRKSELFKSKEEAEAFAKNKKDAYVVEQTKTQYTSFEICIKDPVSHTDVELGITFESKEDANAYIEEHLLELSNKAAEKIFKENKTEREGMKYFEVHKSYVDGKYFVTAMGMQWILDEFDTIEEAKQKAQELEDEYKKLVEEQKKIVYFSPKESKREGKDWRDGKDATPEMFMKAFGFRGVQFGNWTNARDRQEALNQAYDAFMDLAEVLGKSPKTMSLNGELGLAFGARGSGSALAHYEPGEVVINLTKTKGAGSLAHEWWHALDNYLSRRVGVASGFATALRGEKLREELKDVIGDLLRAIDTEADYGQRSRAMGAYWGSTIEITARLFAEYVNKKIRDKGEKNAFLSRGVSPSAIEKRKEINWRRYQLRVSRLISRYGSKSDFKPMTKEEFMKSPDALAGFPHPTDVEVEKLSPYLDKFFAELKESEEMLYHKAEGKDVEIGDVLPDEAAMRDALIDRLEKSGIQVVTESEEAQAVLDAAKGNDIANAKKRALETASLAKDARSLTVVPSANGAKVLNNLDNLAKKLEENHTQPKTFIGEISYALGATRYGSNSQYATFETVNGQIVTIRISDHNASTKKFDNAGRTNSISIVITPKPNQGIELGGDAHIIEVYYNSLKLRKAAGKPLAEIVRSIKQALYSGEFKDTTGLAERQEVNMPPQRKTSGIKLQKKEQSAELMKHKEKQLEIINKSNPAPDSYHTWVRSTDDILTLQEAVDEVLAEDEEYELSSYPDVSDEMIREALRTGKIRVYSSKPIKNGVFVTPSMMQAKDYAGRGAVYSKEVPISDVAWINTDEGQYAATSDNANEKDTGIKYFRTSNGEVYGFTDMKKIYIDRKIAGAETPIHEYTHLWAQALRNANPEEWRNIIELMRGTNQWEQVKKNYPELTTDDEIAEEVLAHYSGRRGAERLRAEQKKVLESDASVLDKAAAVDAIERVKQALSKFWKAVSKWFDVHFTSAEEVADKVLYDMLNGENLGNAGVNIKSQEIIGRSLSADEAEDFVTDMEDNADTAPDVDLTIENWNAQFGAGAVNTPIGEVKMGENQFAKLMRKGRNGKLGMIKPTLENPDVIVEDASEAKHGNETERASSYVFIRSFKKADGSRFYHFTSITVSKDGKEVVISNQEKSRNKILRLLQEGKVIWHTPKYVATSSAERQGLDYEQLNIAETATKGSGITPQRTPSDDKGTINASKSNANGENNDDTMFRDGDVVREKRGRYSGKDAKQQPVQLSLFDTTEENGEQVAESEQKANAAIEAFAEVYDRYVEEEDDIITGNSENETNSVEAEMMQAQDEFISALTDFYKQNGNLEEDATRMAKDMLAQVRSEVEFNRIYQRNATANGERKIEQQSVTKETEQNPQKAEQEHSCVTAGGEVIDVKSTGGLPKLKEGEFANIERQFAVDKNFAFDGKAKIESIDDVAYVFRQLESYCVEHAFAMLVKDGKPTIIHLGMGTFSETQVNLGALKAAVEKFGADSIYFIHNHPSGKLIPSAPDRSLFRKIQSMFDGTKIALGAIIIDTTSGKYAQFGGTFDEQRELPDAPRKSVEHTVQSFSRQVFNETDSPQIKIERPKDVAKAISTLRLGKRKKIGFLLVDRRSRVVGNIFTNFASYKNSTEVADRIVKYALHYGAAAVITYGNAGFEGIDNLKSEILRISGQSVQMLDSINVSNGLSALESGVMEDAAPYEKSEAISDADADSLGAVLYRQVEDEETEKWLEGQPKIKVYRSMVLIDGKLYPPMSSKAPGSKQLRNPSEIGKWEEAEEAPDKAVWQKNGWYFVLKKDNGKEVRGVAYNPYIHTSRTMLNDQFAEAQSRDNLVVVEMEVPESELESGYKAEKAKDSVGAKQWKAGIIQGMLSGTREVILSRWAKPVRVVPVEEVAENIAEMLDGKVELMPSNVVTPQQRKALEARGVKFVDTNNKGKIKKGENAGKTWASVYGSKSKKKKSGNNNAQRNASVERMNKLRQQAEQTVSILGIGDRVTIMETPEGLTGRKAKAKGWFDPKTGNIVVVLSNHTSAADVEQTLLHEAVAHYGLRQLFGEHFDTFLDNVFNNASEEVRRKIVALAAKNGWDFRKATEEYLASLAESTEFDKMDKGFWRQVKNFFLEMLDNIGLKGFSGVTLTDNELRYILWRSYENLTEPGGNRTIFGEAADVAKQYELQVGEYAPENANDDALFRDGDPVQRERALARSVYDARVRSGMYQTIEALQDSMLSIKEAMKLIAGEKYIENIDGFENAYMGENRLSSTNQAEVDAFAMLAIKPMLAEVTKLARNGKEYKTLTEYMMAKHGLERNAYMRNEALQNGDSTANDRDFAGLTALMGESDVHAAELAAQQLVNDYEQAHDTTALWEKVNAVSKALLQKSYDCGMMNKETYEKVRDMYEYYIPLRGFDEATGEDVYSYLSSNNRIGAPLLKKAKGRKSKADDPIATLCLMADSTIMQGNRNKLVKQRFLNFVLNHPSDLVSVSELWLEYDDVNDEWIPVFPDNIETDDSPEVVEQKMQDFETKMQGLANQNPKRYKRSRDAKGIPYRIVEKRDAREHIVIVKRNGRDYVLTINGNPRAAQAINGLTNPDNDAGSFLGPFFEAGEWVNRRLSALYTTYNPDFVASNFMRDLIYTNFSVWVKEGMNYALRYHKNYARVNPFTLLRLIKKYNSGKLDMNDKLEAQFYEFMMNGGETGFANIRDIEDQKSAIREELKGAHGKLKIKKALMLLKEQLDDLNRAAENCARFAAFITSREMGRSLDRSIYDAKEISVNFNKKGSGAKFVRKTGQTIAGNVAGTISGAGRAGYVFWNAGIQGLTNFGRQAKRHPARAFAASATLFLLGAVVAYLGRGDDDDDDKEKKNKTGYYDLPEFVRRSNILFKAGDSWIAIPLPIEYRAIYGMGELMMSVIGGKEHLTDEELAHAIAGQVTQVLPIDFLEGGGANAFIPSALKPFTEAYIMNKSWTGLPIYKDTPFNKEMPEWTKAYPRDNKYLVNLAAVINEATGGDKYTKGGVDINPSKLGYMLNGCFGGISSTIDRMSKLAATATGSMEYDPSSLPVLNRFIKAGDERTEYRAVNREYARLKEEHDVIAGRLRGYMKDTKSGVFNFAEKIDFINNSPEYARYMLFEVYKPTIDRLYEKRKTITDDAQIKELDRQINEVKRILIEEVEATRNRE